MSLTVMADVRPSLLLKEALALRGIGLNKFYILILLCYKHANNTFRWNKRCYS